MTTNTNMQQNPPDPRDEMLETALRETLGGERAPDLTNKVLASLRSPDSAEANADIYDTLQSAAANPAPENIVNINKSRNRMIPGFLAGAALAAAVVAAIFIIFWRPAAPTTLPALARAGTTEHRDGGTWITRAAPSEFPFAVSAGDRFRCAENQQSVLFISDLGTLWVRESTEIEVLQMNWNDFGKGAVLGSVTVGVVAGSIYWFSGGSAARASSGETVTLAKIDGNGGEAHAKLIDELTQAKDKIRELESIASAAKRKPAVSDNNNTTNNESPASAPGFATAQPPASSVTFSRKGLEESLAKVDWNVFGEQSKKLAAKLAELTEKLAKGEQPSMELIGEIQAINGLLVQQTGILMKGGIPGTYPNSTFTHPLVVANQLASLLKQAGKNLSPDQTKAMDALAQKFADEDDFRRARMASDAPQLQQFMDEMALRSRFYKEAWELLSPEQLAQMDFPATKGLGNFDIFGTGVAWGPLAKPMAMESREAVSVNLMKKLSDGANFTDTQLTAVQNIVNKWVAKYPDSYWSTPSGYLAQQRVFPVDQMEVAAKMQLEMYKDMLNSPDLTAEQKEAITKNPYIYIPYVPQKK